MRFLFLINNIEKKMSIILLSLYDVEVPFIFQNFVTYTDRVFQP